MNRIEMNGDLKRPPKEVQEARKVISNWLQIENEAKLIRKYGNDAIQKKLYHPTKPRKKPTNNNKNAASSLSSSFELKFAKMKERAIHRAKKQSFEQYRHEILYSSRKESKIKTKQMVEKALEFKEEETTNNTDDDNKQHRNTRNAEQRLRYDLIPCSKVNKTKKRMETKKVLLFQLSEIEKQEKYHNKKLIANICRKWRKQIIKSKEIENNAVALYRKNLLKHLFIEWNDYIIDTKQMMVNVFREWIKIRLLSQHKEIRAIEFYENQLQDNIFFIWRDYAKQSAECRKIRAMQLQTRLYKMNKIAKRHYKYSIYFKIIKYWKEYTNEEQTKRFLEQQREQRKLKIRKLISNVKQKTSVASIPAKHAQSVKKCELEIKAESITHHEHKHNHKENKSINKQSISKSKTKTMYQSVRKCETPQTETVTEVDNISDGDDVNDSVIASNVESKEMISHSIQTEMKMNEIQETKQSQPSRMNKIRSIPALKPSKLVIKMEQRALERKQKREKLMELKKQKEKEYQEFLQKQKEMEAEKLKEAKRMEKEERLKRLQRQQHLKQIENNKLKLSQLHYHKSLIMYHGWIPWMQLIERNNFNYHRIVVLNNHNVQKLVEFIWILCVLLLCDLKLNSFGNRGNQ